MQRNPIVTHLYGRFHRKAEVVLRVVQEEGGQFPERNPGFPLHFEDYPYLIANRASLDSPGDPLTRPEFFGDLPADTSGFLLVEPFTDQILHCPPNLLAEGRFVHTVDLDAFDRVAGIDVRSQSLVVADPRDEEDQPNSARRVGGRDLTRSRDVFGEFEPDAVGQLPDGVRVERHAFQSADVSAESRAKPVVVDPRYLDRVDDRWLTGRRHLGHRRCVRQDCRDQQRTD